MGNAKIDLGLSTEEKPEWTISLDFLQNDKEEEKKEIKKPRESIFNDAQDSDFLSSEAPIQMHTPMEEDSGFSISGDLDESIQTTETSVTSPQESVALDFASNDSTSNENMTMLDDLSSERDEDASTMLSDSFDDTEDASTVLSDSFDDTGDASTMLSDSFDDTEDPSSMIAVGPATDASESLLANEVDAVDERLTHLANSMGQWDQSENVLSEAAAMLSQEEKSLNVSEQQLNTNKFDGSAPVEQTEPVSEISDSDRHETELGSISFENREITNDMFDMGYDFSDETENYSDENINLDSFKGSIKDADEFAPEPDNSLNLDESESGTDSSDLDLSNLVAAAMSNLSHHQEEQETEPEERAPEPVVIMESVEEDTISKSTEYDEPTVEAVVEEPILESIPVPVEEVVEDAVDEPAEETVQNLVAEPAKEPEPVLIAESTEEPEPELVTEPMEEPESVAEPTEEPEPELVTEPTEEPEPELVTESTEEPELVAEPTEEPEPELVTVSDIVEKAEKGELPEWKASPEDFSHSVSTTTKQASDEDDIASLIIEDYIEVPTVTEVESKLKKREKEKKKSKSKDKNADGFAFSLEDINAESEKMPEVEEVADEPNPTPVEEDSPAQTESDAVQGDSAKEIAATAEEAPAVPEEPINISTVYAKHLIRKEGKVKRSYYSLYYK